MNHEINVKAFGEAIQRQREGRKLTVRAAAEQMENVSPSTLSRVERGNVPDLDTYMRICRWLEVEPGHFAVEPVTNEASKLKPMLNTEDIIVHLRADKLLNNQTRNALITMIEVAYAAARRNILPNEAKSNAEGI